MSRISAKVILFSAGMPDDSANLAPWKAATRCGSESGTLLYGHGL